MSVFRLVKSPIVMRRKRRRELFVLCSMIVLLLVAHVWLVHQISASFEESKHIDQEMQREEVLSISETSNLVIVNASHLERKYVYHKEYTTYSYTDWIISYLKHLMFMETWREPIPAPPSLTNADIIVISTASSSELHLLPTSEQESTDNTRQVIASNKENTTVETIITNTSVYSKYTMSSDARNYNINTKYNNTESDAWNSFYGTKQNTHDEIISENDANNNNIEYNDNWYSCIPSHRVVDTNDTANSDTQIRSNVRVSPLSNWKVNPITYENALQRYYSNLHVILPAGNPEQPEHEYTDLDADHEGGIELPYNVHHQEQQEERWKACDSLNASFSSFRDEQCQEYLANIDNMQSIKAMDSHLLQGRTIKMKIQYAHNNIEAIVKISQRKFVFEAASEYMAFVIDRAIGFNRVPTTIYKLLPLNYLRAAAAYSPLYSQWFNRYIELYNKTNQEFVACDATTGKVFTREKAESSRLLQQNTTCVYVAIQLWMREVHPTLNTFLALPYEYNDQFAEKYYVPGHALFSSIKPSRLRAIGELLDRFIFDFLIGNSDRGMNDHNNFVYGGCSIKTECSVPTDPSDRLQGLAKYAYLDHGSSMYSHKEVEDNPFFGELQRIKICRFRRVTIESLKNFAATSRNPYPLIKHIESHIPPSIYNIITPSLIRKVQNRLDKIVRIADKCLETYSNDVVYSLPSYDLVRIAEEDVYLPDESFSSELNKFIREYNY